MDEQRRPAHVRERPVAADRAVGVAIEDVDVGTEVRAVGGDVAIDAAGGELIISVGLIGEPDGGPVGGKVIAGTDGVKARVPAHQDVLGKDGLPGGRRVIEVLGQGWVSGAGVAENAVRVVRGDVVLEDETAGRIRRRIDGEYRAAVEDRVVIEGCVNRTLCHVEEVAADDPRVYPGVGDVVEEVVADGETSQQTSWTVGDVVAALQGDAAGGVADDVVAEGDVFGHLPGAAGAVLIELEQDSDAGLGGAPVVLEDIPFDQDAPALFELEQVLDLGPLTAPGERLNQVVSADDDVGGDGVGNVATGATEE